jgi:hypothetical protein
MVRNLLIWIGIGAIGILGTIVFKLLTLDQGIQILLTYTLVVVTAEYAMETFKMRKSSEETTKAALKQAEASNEMVAEMRQQRLNASQPVIWPRIPGWNYNDNGLIVRFENIGNGPALDIDIFLGTGDDPIIKDCEHDWYSYLTAGDKNESEFLVQGLVFNSHGGRAPLNSSILNNIFNKLVGKYTLLVEWCDLYMSGPFFQARLSFSLETDSSGKIRVKEDVVHIKPISAKSKPIT